MALVVSRRFLTAEGRVRSRAAHVSFVVEKWQWGMLVSEYILGVSLSFQKQTRGWSPKTFKKKFAYRSITGDSSSFTLLLNFNLQVHAMHEAFSCRPLTAAARASPCGDSGCKNGNGEKSHDIIFPHHALCINWQLKIPRPVFQGTTSRHSNIIFILLLPDRRAGDALESSKKVVIVTPSPLKATNHLSLLISLSLVPTLLLFLSSLYL